MINVIKLEIGQGNLIISFIAEPESKRLQS